MAKKKTTKNKIIMAKTITLGGREVETIEKELPLDQIRLDPENPRAGYFKDNQQGNDFTQEELEFFLTQTNDREYNQLKNSIEYNHGITNPIWVFEKKDGKYLVVDGNTRLLIYHDLRKKYPKDDRYKTIKCIIVPSRHVGDEGEDFVRILFHLRTSNDWDTYAKAKYLYYLYDKIGKTYEDLERLTKMSQSQIEQFIKAYKAMQEQFLPGYQGQENMTNKFSYFVEYFKNKVDILLQSIGLGLKDFCKWIYNEELTRAQDVRKIPKIFKNEEAKKALIEKGYSAAFEQLIIYKPGLSSKLFDAVEDVIGRLRNLTRDEITDIAKEVENEEKRKLLHELSEESQKIVSKFD